MTPTNYPLVDFLELDPATSGVQTLWKACAPTCIARREDDVIVTIPFQKQDIANGITDAKDAARVDYHLRLRAYGDKVLRISMGFGQRVRDHSPMLELDPDLALVPLRIEATDDKWTIKDAKGKVRAMFNLSMPATCHWSDLLPAPEQTVDVSFYPDGEKQVRIHAYDQFFPGRMDAIPLGYLEEDSRPRRALLSLHAKADEKFAGTGERFSKMDLSGGTFQMKNRDAQGVNSRRTYKSVPFYLSSEMYRCSC